MHRALRPTPFFAVLVMIWLVGMSWQLYPHFADTVRVEGRLETRDAYVEDICRKEVDDRARSCRAEAGAEAKRLVRAERWRVALLILAPLFLYLGIYFPARLAAALFARTRVRPS